jgi:hypothetical protein
MLVALMNKRPPLVLVDTNVTLVENTLKKEVMCVYSKCMGRNTSSIEM